jgi:hypothetical protein
LTDFRHTRLFKDGLAARDDDARHVADKREELRQGYLVTRANAGLLADQIPQDLHGFTLHDEHHVDALWELASDIAGPDIVLTPTETFAFGVAAAIHDLGLAVAAYPRGLKDIQGLPEWRDAAASLLRARLGRVPSTQELQDPPADVAQAATDAVLRQLHGERARDLGQLSWKNDGQSLFLIESEILRGSYGWLVGQIAASHNWPLEDVRHTFDEENAPAGYPGAWTVNARKVACLLRAADAAHLDARRAPRLLQAVRQPTGVAADHWRFQSKMHRPAVVDERMRFTSGSPFKKDEAPAWWVGLEMLRVVDDELRAIDALFLHLGLPRFAAKGVLGAEDPQRMATYVRTEGWTPVDITIRVSDVARLVERLGGSRLYGDDEGAPLRELIQNGQDAIKARRALEQRASDWGTVTVRLMTEGGQRWLEVTDSGVGMSEFVLTKKLLDFGSSLWGSSDLALAIPGLAATSFQAVGRFGIGFFSILMLGSHVQVITRRFDEALAATRVLELADGAASRPILRPATPAERLVDAGTTVRVALRPAPLDDDSLAAITRLDDLVRLCGRVAPALDVALNASVDDASATVSAASDWLSVADQTLLSRISGREVPSPPLPLRNVLNKNGVVVGRASIAPSGGYAFGGSVQTVGGFRTAAVSQMLGLFIAERPNLARNSAKVVLSRQELAAWLSDEAARVDRNISTSWSQIRMSRLVTAYGGDTHDLGIVTDPAGDALNEAEIVAFARTRDEIAIVSEAELVEWATGSGFLEDRLDEIEFADDVLRLEFPGVSLGAGWPAADEPDMLPRVLAAIATGWEADIDELEDAMETIPVGTLDHNDDVEVEPAFLVRRPEVE